MPKSHILLPGVRHHRRGARSSFGCGPSASVAVRVCPSLMTLVPRLIRMLPALGTGCDR